MSDFTQPFYTSPQVAELLQVHGNTIYRLVRAKKIEHYKVGAQIRISADIASKTANFNFLVVKKSFCNDKDLKASSSTLL